MLKDWFGVVGVDMTDDYLERRQNAVGALATKWRRPFNATTALKRADEIAQALTRMTDASALPDELRRDVAEVIRSKSPMFEDTEAATLEIRVCTGAALCDYLEKPAQTEAAPIFHDALVTATEFVDPPTDPALVGMWSQIVRELDSEAEEDAHAARERQSIDPADSASAIAALTANARLDREEINILWWALNDWSVLAHERFSALSPAAHVVLAPIELASLVTIPAGEAHRALSFRNLAQPNEELELKDIADLGQYREQVANSLSAAASLILGQPRVFPVLRTLEAESADAAQQAWNELGLNTEVKRSAADWASTLMRELSLLRRFNITVRREPVNAA